MHSESYRWIVAARTLVACFAVGTFSYPTSAAPSQPYTWRNVQIVGGGFIPGIVYNASEPGLVYARTDIGGAYRLDNATGRWIPLTDFLGWDDWNLTGIASVATDPVNPNNVYLAAGTYTNDWTNQNGAILRSSDRGATWQRTALPFKIGGNMPGRGCGERLAIDPNNNSILYLAAPSGHGLWRSTDAGVSWSKVAGFPTGGTFREGPASDPYLGDIIGLVWVTFDKRTGSPGNATQTIYVGVAETAGPSVYRTNDGGATWSAVPGQPIGYIPHKGVLDTVNGALYIATSDKAGPYEGGKGQVWKMNTTTGVWTEISPFPVSSGDNYYGYSGLTVDRQNPGTVMVTAYSSWWPDTHIWRSTNGGATWTRIWDFTRYPNRSFRYTMNISASPWLYWGGAPTGGRPGAEVYPKLGWMTEALEIDPFNSNKMLYGTGATLFGSDNLTAWGSGAKITISVKAVGIEETAIQEIVSLPAGPQLISGMYDIYGFTHTNVDVVPNAFFENPRIATITIDYAELTPSIVWRAGDGDSANGIKSAGYSTNGGTSWTPVPTEPSGTTNGGTIAVSATGARIVWAPNGAPGVYYTSNNGRAWTLSAGLPAESRVISDRVNSSKFYAFKNGVFYVSTNGGQTFTAKVSTGLPTSVRLKAMPGREGEIWLAGSGPAGVYGLWRSSDSGATFTKLPNVAEADNVGFGKAAAGQSFMAIFSSAKIDGVRGIYRSDDAGVSWVRINDDLHQYGWTGGAITGDPRIFGRVYLATNGRGILYADPAP
jgi:xyloglucan-specific exo-beta-1,4-glucanase